MRHSLKTTFKILHNNNDKVRQFFISFYFMKKLTESSFLKVGHAFFTVEFALLIKNYCNADVFVQVLFLLTASCLLTLDGLIKAL